jgi:Carboxypeptidase regulatory-like domain/TonB dependent receptor
MHTCIKFLRYGILASIFLLPLSSLGQATGTIVGTVTDQSGAIIAGAKVTATQIETQVVHAASTNGSGIFAISNLAVGTYDVKVEASGFSPNKASGISLDVSQQRSLAFALTVAGRSETTEVTVAAPLLNTADGSLAGLVTEKQVDSLPLNGRSIQNLVMLQPGMAQDTGTMGFLAPQWISNGNRGETEVATLDGADATDSEMGTVQFWNFNLDAIAEFKVQQANYSAEYGQGGGSITQIVSKSGTNRFHGSVFEFIRNSALDAHNYFSTTVPPFQRNEFGATIGGPIYKGKTFFFGQYAGYRQRLGEPTIISVPTAAERTGLVSIGSDEYQVPLNAVAAGILNKYPLPNQPSGAFGANTYNFNFKQPTDDDQFSIRIDQHFSERDYLFARVTYMNNTEDDVDPVAAVENTSFSSTDFNDPRNYAISETHNFSDSLINTAIFAVNRQIEGTEPPSQQFTQTTFSDGSLANWGPDTFITKYVETYYDPSDKMVWSKGKNFFNFGVEYRYGQDDGFGVAGIGPNGQYVFSPGTILTQDIPSTNGGAPISAGTGSPNGLISMMEGLPSTYGRATTIPGFGPTGGGGAHWGLRIWHISTYLQDDIKFTSKLTVNLGLRYEYNSVPYEIRSRLGGIVESGSLFGSFVLNPSPLYQPQRANFAPRLGFAYAATNRTVLRGGFAIFTNIIPTIYPDQAATDFPLASLSYLPNAAYSLTPLPVSLPALTSTTGQVMPPDGDTTKIPADTPVNLAPIANVIGPISGFWPSSQLKNGYTATGNVTVEQKLPEDMALQLSYVTSNGIELYNAAYPNAYTGAETQFTPYTNVTPGLGEVQLQKNQGVSHYNALQVQARKISPLRGLQYQVNYTWAKNLTDSDSVFSGSGTSGGISLNNPTCIRCEYARASFGVAQRLVANFSYNVPGKWGMIPSFLSRGWQTLGIYSAQSGFPFSVVSPYGTLQYGYDSLNGVGARPFFVKTATRAPSGGPQFFSDDVIANEGNYYSIPTTTSASLGIVQTQPGNLPRNVYTSPSWWDFDLSLLKETHLSERVNTQFRAEFFNVLNHPTFAVPNGTLGNASFGVSTATESTERQLQFGLRVIF